MYPSERLTQAATGKPSALYAVDNEDDYGLGEDMKGDPFAAMTSQQEPPSRKRAWEDQQPEMQPASRQRRSKDDRPQAQRFQAQGATGTFSTGTRGGDGRRSQGGRQRPQRGQLPPKAELPPDAPRPDGDPQMIQEFIRKHKVCFYHARGHTCPHMKEQGFCVYSHSQDPIPWGAYPRQARQNQTEEDHTRELASIATQLEQMRYENMEDMATLHSEIQEELGDEETAGEPEDDPNN